MLRFNFQLLFTSFNNSIPIENLSLDLTNPTFFLKAAHLLSDILPIL